jgi:serine/threonine-protein kinase
MWLSKIKPLVPSFADSAAGIGHINLFPDSDGSIRSQIHAIGYLDNTLIKWNVGPGVAFHMTPFRNILNKKFQTSLFRDKIVILGPTAPGIGDRFVTPISSNLPGVEIIADSVSNILRGKFFVRPQWITFIELGIILLFGLFISFLLPKLKAGTGAIITLILFLSYGTAGMILFFHSNIWLKITPQIVLLGLLDLAFEKFRKCPIDEPGVKDLLYNLGLDYERKRQFNKAMSTYNMIIEDDSAFKDLSERIPKLKGVESTMIFGASGGAMGVVYKGVDHTIHRTVAIKTLRLSDFEEGEVGEIKERFFREAESAGLLNHPNIVSIYDAGVDHDLAYIAMEFLNGEDLAEFTHKGNLFSLRNVINIIAQVADALGYAHKNDVVHRDIKPANIMLLKDTGDIKVTDFGIARITSSSKTKTGVILGTPSYMSPEQVSGKKLDGRSDIFSLGVVMFEMLTGEKPFVSEDVTSLMYQITREKHPSVREINPKIPPVVEKIIDNALT